MKRIYTIITIFLLWTLLGVASKVCFLVLYCVGDSGVTDWLAVLWHGLLLDVAIAGYLTVIPGLLLVVSLFLTEKASSNRRKSPSCRWWWRGYFAVTALIASVAYISNLGLYAYWGFPLDNTPILYLRTSPTAAVASMSAWQLITVLIAVIALAVAVYKAFMAVGSRVRNDRRAPIVKRLLEALALVVATAMMIIPIRGGFGTGTNHTGNVYFSSDVKLNHAAVNPIFSFMESVAHQEEIATRYRLLEADEADRLFADMVATRLRPDAVRHEYNVVLVCLESFSKYIMTESGHVSGVTPNLDRYSKEGIYFTNFYANSFRTDRALVSVLSGLPAQPTMSVMDMPRISTSLPSIASALGRAGYATHFYYGGDTNYSNMRSYLVGTGFQKITSQYDFPARQSTGKWGVPDGTVFDRILEDIDKETGKNDKPFLKVFMTSSSHEPFDVPDYQRLQDPALNAFAYADHCLGQFVEALKARDCWQNTLVVIVPDHLGAYPPQIDNYQLWRYEIPMVMLGGMVTEPRQVLVTGAQTDICATVMGILGLPHTEFRYSKDILDDGIPHYAFFTFPDAMGLVEGDSYVIYDNTSSRVVANSGDSAVNKLLPNAKAYLQKLYDDIGTVRK